MKDIFHKFRQGLGLPATDVPAHQETLASAKEEPGIIKGAQKLANAVRRHVDPI